MKGCISLTDSQIESILDHLNLRDRALFILGLKTGFRISELLSLQVKDVYKNGAIKDYLEIKKSKMKGKGESRTVPLHEEAKDILRALISIGKLDSPEYFLFSGRRKLSPISRVGAWKAFKSALNKSGISGKIASHSMRKTFAKRMYRLLNGDLISTQKALGHKSINSTICYLAIDDQAISEAILKG